MYNLFRFFVRYHLFILFILLESFCFLLVYRHNSYQKTQYRQVASEVGGKLFNSYRLLNDYLYLKQFSDSLVAENARLHAQIPESLYDESARTMTIKDTVNGKFEQVYDFIPAKVIRNSVNQASNIIWINKGRLQGIEKQMGVINPNGVVGQIIDVTDHYAATMSLLSKDFKVSAKIKKSGFFGNLYWEGINSAKARLEEIPKHVPVSVGDTIVTSGYSELYPENIIIGKVTKVQTAPDKNFQEIEVGLSTNFSSLSYVYVVKNLRKNEFLQFDTLNRKDDR